MGRIGLGTRSPLRTAVAPAALASLLLGSSPAAAQTAAVAHSSDPPAPIEITVLDVGHGDAIVVRDPSGGVAMIDAGSGDILRFLQRMRVDSLDLLVLSNPAHTHSAGLVDVLTARPVGTFVHGSGAASAPERVTATLNRLEEVSVLSVADSSETVSLGSATLRLLPLPDTARDGPRSVGLIVDFGDFRALFAGDADREQQDAWIDSALVPDVTLLKAPGHGTPGAVSRTLLTVARPEVVVVSVGPDNALGLPSPAAMTAYEAAAVEVLRTDRGGHVTILGYPDGSYQTSRPTDLSSVTVPGTDRATPIARRPIERGTTAPFSLVSVDVEPGLADLPEWDLNGEYVTIGNHGPSDIPIGGWRVCDLSTRCFRFPLGALLRAESTVRVYSGYGHTDGYTFFMNETRAVWNDNGDEATLYDARDVVRGRHVY